MPTVSVLFRVNIKADEIEGHQFEPATIFKINVQGIHMNEVANNYNLKFFYFIFTDTFVSKTYTPIVGTLGKTGNF